MIYTVTFNPSLDYVVDMESLEVGEINRAKQEALYPGGKGINVTLVLHNLGLESMALGFTAGATGKDIIRQLEAYGCESAFITVQQGFSRINTKIRTKQGETALNGNGPVITAEEMEQLLQQLEALLQPNDYLVLAGSIPSCLPASTYENILERLQGRGVHFIVDATGQLLAKVLKYHPWLIKPNNYELEEILQTTLKTEDDLVAAAKELQARGAQNVLVSRAEHGALLVDADGCVHKRPALQGKLVNSVGAGDSMVAGFLTGYLRQQNYEEALLWGLSTGSATAFKEWLADVDDVRELLARYENENY